MSIIRIYKNAGYEYRLTIEMDTQDFDQNANLSIHIRVERKSIAAAEEQYQTIAHSNISIEHGSINNNENPESLYLNIATNDRSLIRRELETILSAERWQRFQQLVNDHNQINQTAVDNISGDWEEILTENAAERVIDQIPAWFILGDPFAGCLIRSGISTSVAQILICKNKTIDHNIGNWTQKIRQIKNCLLDSLNDMAKKVVRKSLKCILWFGL